MILRSNLPRLCEIAQALSKVLDVGGWYQPYNLATHVLDLRPWETRRTQEALVPGNAERFSAGTWVVHDACTAPWPFPDKFFDFAICSHLLEDVRDPLVVCKELVRVAKSGYVETPTRVREIYSKQRFFALKCLLGNIPEIGFCHHRWFVEVDGTHLRFTAKTTALLQDRRRYLTRLQLGRNLTEQESGLGLFWEEQFTCEEVIVNVLEDYTRFGKQALEVLANSK
jgi:ubiquinone/menaquinone biosynthesis C-methylase UbiE